MRIRINQSDFNRIMQHMTHTDFKNKVENKMQECVAVIQGDARNNCPVDTGNLRQSIDREVRSEGDTITGIVFTNCEYAPYVEYGTGPVGAASRPAFAQGITYRQDGWVYTADNGETYHYTKGRPAHPYMYPSLHDNQRELIELMKECLR